MQIIKTEVSSKGIMILTIDQPNSSANILSKDFFTELNEVLTEIENGKNLKGLVFSTAKEKVFLAGADLVSMQKNIDDAPWLEEVIEVGQQTFNRIEKLTIPTTSAIHGACLGGGLELSLACNYRVASRDSCTKIGLPEVMLGILPAWGGCTRLPRTIGLTKSLKVILSGKPYPSSFALKLGIVDKLSHSEGLVKCAEDLCLKTPRIKRGTSLFSRIFSSTIISMARKNVLKLTRGNYPAPLKILEVLSVGIKSSARKGLQLEKEAFLELSKTEACRNLIRLFFLQEKSKKLRHKSARTKFKTSNVAVIGAGTMGAGIAQWVSSRGKYVTLKDVSKDLVSKGLEKIGDLFVSAALNHKMDRPTVRDCFGRLYGMSEDIPLKNKDIVIEVIVENFNIKKEVLANLESKMNKDAILATNTSALSITELGKSLSRPENFIGIHFFNPVHKMKLVEIVVGEATSDETISGAVEFVKSIGKLPVVVKDSPGFLVNRILLPYLVKAIDLVASGEDVERIDRALVSFGMPMGPFRLLDEIGLDVAVHVAKDLSNRLSELKTPRALDIILTKGDYGKKTGKGFYLYNKGKRGQVNKDLTESFRISNGKELKEREIISSLIRVMETEAKKCLEEKIVEDSDSLDFAMVMGTGWAPFKGGPIKYSKHEY
jgi:3-hydroxyacyl-CoA dehydrogenase/enoyl-CoA hydratase/3-hydroxybutyryl-CoA epimerase